MAMHKGLMDRFSRRAISAWQSLTLRYGVEHLIVAGERVVGHLIFGAISLALLERRKDLVKPLISSRPTYCACMMAGFQPSEVLRNRPQIKLFLEILSRV